jgi:hypothetical protein
MVHRPLGLRISDFQPLIPGGRLPQDILKLTLKHVLLGLEFLHSECHLAHTGKLPNYYSLFLSSLGLYLSLRVEVSDHFSDIQAKNILMDIDDENVLTEFEEAEVRDPSPLSRPWPEGLKANSSVGCVCKRLKREEKERSGELELSTGATLGPSHVTLTSQHPCKVGREISFRTPRTSALSSYRCKSDF